MISYCHDGNIDIYENKDVNCIWGIKTAFWGKVIDFIKIMRYAVIRGR